MYLSLICVLLFYLNSNTSGFVVEDGSELPDLDWPSTYYIEGEKWHLTSGLVEDFKYWRTKKRSRIDWNKGAAKTIAIRKGKNKTEKYGVKYDINPVTTKEFENKMVCTRSLGKWISRIELDDILPETYLYFHKGIDRNVLSDKEVHEFFYLTEEDEEAVTEDRKRVWAYLDGNGTSWIPVKMEEKSFNKWIGGLTTHVVWHFNNYKAEVNDDDFSIDSLCDIVKNKGEDTNKKNVDLEEDEHTEKLFKKFQQQHNKSYKHKTEYQQRKTIFKNNLRRILENNNKHTGFKLGINKFSDRTPEELRRMRGLRRRKDDSKGRRFPYTRTQIKEIAAQLPEEVDLRIDGLVSPVGEQSDCGSCWTFGTTSAVEGALARQNGGRLIKLSNQALLDCAWGYDANEGCEGGSDTGAYQWMEKVGLPTEEEYGLYTNKNGFCRIKNMTTLYPIRGFVDVTPYNVDALKVALINHGPLSVSMDATDVLNTYTGGIFYDTTCNITNLNHEVTLVGYGQLDGDEYWIVKNSWGKDWGIDGYFHMSTRDNSCGITSEPSYPIL